MLWLSTERTAKDAGRLRRLRGRRSSRSLLDEVEASGVETATWSQGVTSPQEGREYHPKQDAYMEETPLLNGQRNELVAYCDDSGMSMPIAPAPYLRYHTFHRTTQPKILEATTIKVGWPSRSDPRRCEQDNMSLRLHTYDSRSIPLTLL